MKALIPKSVILGSPSRLTRILAGCGGGARGAGWFQIGLSMGLGTGHGMDVRESTSWVIARVARASAPGRRCCHVKSKRPHLSVMPSPLPSLPPSLQPPPPHLDVPVHHMLPPSTCRTLPPPLLPSSPPSTHLDVPVHHATLVRPPAYRPTALRPPPYRPPSCPTP